MAGQHLGHCPILGLEVLEGRAVPVGQEEAVRTLTSVEVGAAASTQRGAGWPTTFTGNYVDSPRVLGHTCLSSTVARRIRRSMLTFGHWEKWLTANWTSCIAQMASKALTTCCSTMMPLNTHSQGSVLKLPICDQEIDVFMMLCPLLSHQVSLTLCPPGHSRRPGRIPQLCGNRSSARLARVLSKGHPSRESLPFLQRLQVEREVLPRPRVLGNAASLLMAHLAPQLRRDHPPRGRGSTPTLVPSA